MIGDDIVAELKKKVNECDSNIGYTISRKYVESILEDKDDIADLKLWVTRVRARNKKYEDLRIFLTALFLKNPKAEEYAHNYLRDMQSGTFLPTLKGTYNLFYQMFDKDTVEVINVIQCPTYRKEILPSEIILITT